jgi:hypothetical protein
MAIKLTDIVTVMKDKWTYGDKFFGYTEEFNDNHKTFYPSLLITPPDSVFPEVGLDNGWENYTFEVYFSDLYNRTAQANESIEQRWENLQDLGTEWLDNFLKYYQAEAPITGFLEDESVSIERNKEVANDQLIQIKMTFTWRVLSKCFRPQSTPPNEISGLTSWLRADSNVSFKIPTKKVSIIGDGSGAGNGVAQTDNSFQPLRYSYGGGNLNKTMLTFKNNSLVSDNNFVPSSNQKNFTIIEVSQINTADSAVFGYYDLGNDRRIEMGTDSSGMYKFYMKNNSEELSRFFPTTYTDLGKPHISVLRFQNVRIICDYLSADWKYKNEDFYNINFYSPTTTFNDKKFRIGCTMNSDGNVPPSEISYKHLDGDFQEIIMYNKSLNDFELAKVVDYLNKKYKIY